MGMMNRERYTGWKPGDRVKYVTACSDPSLTKQEFAKDADINVIMKRYGATGRMPDLTAVRPIFADVSQIGDFGDCLRRVHAATEAFDELPAEIRTRFGNDPVTLVDFLSNPANKVEAQELGLVEKDPSPPVTVPEIKTPVVETKPA